MPVVVDGFRPEDTEAVLGLTRRAWDPVMAGLRSAVPAFVYDSFYPDGWWERQRADVAALLAAEPEAVLVARDTGAGGSGGGSAGGSLDTGTVVGFASTRLHPEDSMGELYILAVDPDHQRQRIARLLMDAAHDRIREAGMRMVLVETGDDPGHAGSRATYEAAGYQRWPVARYFLDLEA